MVGGAELQADAGRAEEPGGDPCRREPLRRGGEAGATRAVGATRAAQGVEGRVAADSRPAGADAGASERRGRISQGEAVAAEGEGHPEEPGARGQGPRVGAGLGEVGAGPPLAGEVAAPLGGRRVATCASTQMEGHLGRAQARAAVAAAAAAAERRELLRVVRRLLQRRLCPRQSCLSGRERRAGASAGAEARRRSSVRVSCGVVLGWGPFVPLCCAEYRCVPPHFTGASSPSPQRLKVAAMDAHVSLCVDCGDGVRLAVHSYGGRGPPLLILHANGMGARTYEPMVEHLRDSFQVYAADLRGHGASAPLPPGALSAFLGPTQHSGF